MRQHPWVAQSSAPQHQLPDDREKIMDYPRFGIHLCHISGPWWVIFVDACSYFLCSMLGKTRDMHSGRVNVEPLHWRVNACTHGPILETYTLAEYQLSNAFNTGVTGWGLFLGAVTGPPRGVASQATPPLVSGLPNL